MSVRLRAIATTLDRLAAGEPPSESDQHAIECLDDLCAGRTLLTTSEAAEYLGVSPTMIKTWLHEGLLSGARWDWEVDRWQIPFQSVIDLAENDR